jgi:hypothetical protein
MHSIVYDYCPTSFSNIWNTNEDRNPNLNLRNASQYIVPNPRIDLFKKSPLYSLPKLWNELDETKLQTNRTTFKIVLCDKLLNELNEHEEYKLLVASSYRRIFETKLKILTHILNQYNSLIHQASIN